MKERPTVSEKYEINPQTILIRPVEYGTKIYSEVWERDGKQLLPLKPLDAVKKACKFFGSSFEGRRSGTRQLIQITHKAPIIIDPYHSIFFFPTASPFSPECMWISHDHIESHHKQGPSSTIVTFRSGQSAILPVSHSSFENQMSRTAMLRIKYSQHMRRMEQYTLRGNASRFEAAEKHIAYEPGP